MSGSKWSRFVVQVATGGKHLAESDYHRPAPSTGQYHSVRRQEISELSRRQRLIEHRSYNLKESC